jgi:hypothetical protein
MQVEGRKKYKWEKSIDNARRNYVNSKQFVTT